MEAIEILRFIFGLALVLFIPGFALTLALWPKTKGEVYQEVISILKGKKISSVCVFGREDEGLLISLKENSVSTQKQAEKADAIVLTDVIEGDVQITSGKTVLDLANNVVDGVKIEDTIDGIERIALSFGMSIAIIPLIGLVLDKTPYGIRLTSTLTSILLFTALFYGIYKFRKSKMKSIQ